MQKGIKTRLLYVLLCLTIALPEFSSFAKMRIDVFAGRADGKRAVEHHDKAGVWISCSPDPA